MSSAAYRRVIEAITRVRGVRGAMLVAAADGLIVADALMEGIRGNAVAALAASLVKRVGNASEASGVGRPHFVQLRGTEGMLLTLPTGEELLLVAVADPDVNVGLVRLEMLRAAEGLA